MGKRGRDGKGRRDRLVGGKKVRCEVLEGLQPQATMRSAKAQADQLASWQVVES